MGEDAVFCNSTNETEEYLHTEQSGAAIFCCPCSVPVVSFVVSETVGGAVPGPSPPSCASTRGAVSRQTAAVVATAWMGAASVRRAGEVLPVTPCCAKRTPVAPTESALLVRGEEEEEEVSTRCLDYTLNS